MSLSGSSERLMLEERTLPRCRQGIVGLIEKQTFRVQVILHPILARQSIVGNLGASPIASRDGDSPCRSSACSSLGPTSGEVTLR